jgi:hypothetical protein
MEKLSKSNYKEKIILPKLITKNHMMITNFNHKSGHNFIRSVESNLKNSSEIMDFLLKSNILNGKNTQQVKRANPISLTRTTIDVLEDVFSNNARERKENSSMFKNLSIQSSNNYCFNKTFFFNFPSKEKTINKESSSNYKYHFSKNINNCNQFIKLTKKQFVKDFSIEYSEGPLKKQKEKSLIRKRIMYN